VGETDRARQNYIKALELDPNLESALKALEQIG
jgi:Flp pilus assembly protein TadD